MATATPAIAIVIATIDNPAIASVFKPFLSKVTLDLESALIINPNAIDNGINATPIARAVMNEAPDIGIIN